MLNDLVKVEELYRLKGENKATQPIKTPATTVNKRPKEKEKSAN